MRLQWQEACSVSCCRELGPLLAPAQLRSLRPLHLLRPLPPLHLHLLLLLLPLHLLLHLLLLQLQALQEAVAARQRQQQWTQRPCCAAQLS